MTICKKEAKVEVSGDRVLNNGVKTGKNLNMKNLYIKDIPPKSNAQITLGKNSGIVKPSAVGSIQKDSKKHRHQEEELPHLRKIKPIYYLVQRNQTSQKTLTSRKFSDNPSLPLRHRINRNQPVDQFIDLTDDSSDCSNAENKLDNYYRESRRLANNLLAVRDEKDKEARFRDTVGGVLRIEYLRRKVLETNCEKINRVFKEKV